MVSQDFVREPRFAHVLTSSALAQILLLEFCAWCMQAHAYATTPQCCCAGGVTAGQGRSPLQLPMDAGAATELLRVPAASFAAWPMHRQHAYLAALQGRRLRASLYVRAGSDQGSHAEHHIGVAAVWLPPHVGGHEMR